jgi:Tat protein translocase TatB subunit
MNLYLFILESLGASELILIGIVALIVFGPRKLPELAKTIGKTMADFRRTTNEFKSTWEREAEFYKEEEEKVINPKLNSTTETVPRNENLIAATSADERIEEPAIKEIDPEKAEQLFAAMKNENSSHTTPENSVSENKQADKREWL